MILEDFSEEAVFNVRGQKRLCRERKQQECRLWGRREERREGQCVSCTVRARAGPD